MNVTISVEKNESLTGRNVPIRPGDVVERVTSEGSTKWYIMVLASSGSIVPVAIDGFHDRWNSGYSDNTTVREVVEDMSKYGDAVRYYSRESVGATINLVVGAPIAEVMGREVGFNGNYS